MYPQRDFQPPEFNPGIPPLSPEVERLLDLQHRLGESTGKCEAWAQRTREVEEKLYKKEEFEKELQAQIRSLEDRLEDANERKDDARRERDEAQFELSKLKTKLAKKKPRQTNKTKETK